MQQQRKRYGYGEAYFGMTGLSGMGSGAGGRAGGGGGGMSEAQRRHRQQRVQAQRQKHAMQSRKKNEFLALFKVSAAAMPPLGFGTCP